MTKAIVAAVALIIVCGIAASCEISVWRECRSDHSWLYCMRLLSK